MIMRKIVFLTEENLEESKKYKRMAAQIQKNPDLFAKLSPEDQARVQSHVWGRKIAGAVAAKRDALDKVALEGKADPKEYDNPDRATELIRRTATKLADTEDAILQKKIQDGRRLKKGIVSLTSDNDPERLRLRARGRAVAEIASRKAGNMSQEFYDDANDETRKDVSSARELEAEGAVARTMAKQRGETLMSGSFLDGGHKRMIINGKAIRRERAAQQQQRR